MIRKTILAAVVLATAFIGTTAPSAAAPCGLECRCAYYNICK